MFKLGLFDYLLADTFLFLLDGVLLNLLEVELESVLVGAHIFSALRHIHLLFALILIAQHPTSVLEVDELVVVVFASPLPNRLLQSVVLLSFMEERQTRVAFGSRGGERHVVLFSLGLRLDIVAIY